MRIILFLFLAILLPAASFAQASDFITLKKKNNRTLHSYFPGSLIYFQTTYGQQIGGEITSIKNDSVFIRQYNIRPVVNNWGLVSKDTVGSYIVAVYYKDIFFVAPKKRSSFGYLKDGNIFLIGGAGYIVLNLVNAAYLHEPAADSKNRKRLGIAAGVTGAGLILKLLHKNRHPEKKYHLEYIHMKPLPKRGF